MRGINLKRPLLPISARRSLSPDERAEALACDASASVRDHRWSGAKAVSSGRGLAVAPEECSDDAAIPWWKRPLDLALVILAAPASVCLFVLFGLYIKLVSRGPVLFAQERIGYKGKPFRLLKFRTMHADTKGGAHKSHLADLMSSGKPMKKLDDMGDDRLLPLGALLRASGLDELPQLINVLRGEMSMVGPRPCTPYEYQLYEPWHKQRLLALPGLTGLWQVNGKNRTTFPEMVRLDIRYARTQTLGLDLKIMAKTIPALMGQILEHRRARRQQGPQTPCQTGRARTPLRAVGEPL
jgi:exopolysaccharide production protein ExoY